MSTSKPTLWHHDSKPRGIRRKNIPLSLMNRDEKSLTQYWQGNSIIHKKDNLLWAFGVYPRNARLVIIQDLILYCTTLAEERKKLYEQQNRYRISIWKTQYPFMGKTLKQTSFLVNGEILNAFQLRSRVSKVYDSILHCTGGPRQYE